MFTLALLTQNRLVSESKKYLLNEMECEKRKRLAFNTTESDHTQGFFVALSTGEDAY